MLQEALPEIAAKAERSEQIRYGCHKKILLLY
jgi:hypothetical protein